jgi:hypothetical protein
VERISKEAVVAKMRQYLIFLWFIFHAIERRIIRRKLSGEDLEGSGRD